MEAVSPSEVQDNGFVGLWLLNLLKERLPRCDRFLSHNGQTFAVCFFCVFKLYLERITPALSGPSQAGEGRLRRVRLQRAVSCQHLRLHRSSRQISASPDAHSGTIAIIEAGRETLLIGCRQGNAARREDGPGSGPRRERKRRLSRAERYRHIIEAFV
jgi:hypothetical protein